MQGTCIIWFLETMTLWKSWKRGASFFEFSSVQVYSQWYTLSWGGSRGEGGSMGLVKPPFLVHAQLSKTYSKNPENGVSDVSVFNIFLGEHAPETPPPPPPDSHAFGASKFASWENKIHIFITAKCVIFILLTRQNLLAFFNRIKVENEMKMKKMELMPLWVPNVVLQAPWSIIEETADQQSSRV